MPSYFLTRILALSADRSSAGEAKAPGRFRAMPRAARQKHRWAYRVIFIMYLPFLIYSRKTEET
jgi:hypothetical protein